MQTGWIEDTNRKWYYLNSGRTIKTGWLQDGDKRYYLNSKGEMQTGSVNIDGKDYEFD
jgi:glucan-binding YG repeat protein